jgi:hypothetical protein
MRKRGRVKNEDPAPSDKESALEKKDRINHLKNSGDDLFDPCMFNTGN